MNEEKKKASEKSKEAGRSGRREKDQEEETEQNERKGESSERVDTTDKNGQPPLSGELSAGQTREGAAGTRGTRPGTLAATCLSCIPAGAPQAALGHALDRPQLGAPHQTRPLGWNGPQLGALHQTRPLGWDVSALHGLLGTKRWVNRGRPALIPCLYHIIGTERFQFIPVSAQLHRMCCAIWAGAGGL